MSVNRFQPHVLVCPEDDANRQLALGFILEVDRARQIDILPVAGGWLHVVKTFKDEHARLMQGSIKQRYMILLLDFDGDAHRVERVKTDIPDDLKDRVFVLGVISEPEDLKRADLGSYEKIGQALAKECREGTRHLWSHELLGHNAGEIERLHPVIRPILF